MPPGCGEGRKGQYTGSGVSTGGSWHLAAAGMTKTMGMGADRIRWVPSQGGAPALQDLVAGGISMFPGSPVEAKALADANQVCVLAVMADARIEGFPDVPTLKEAGVDWTYSNWFSLVAPRGLPEAVQARVLEAGSRAHARSDVEKLMRARGIVPVWDGPQAFRKFAAKSSETAAALLRDLGLARG